MGEIERIDQVAPESNVAHDRRVRRKDEDLSDEERQRMLRKKRMEEKRKQDERAREERGEGHELDIRV